MLRYMERVRWQDRITGGKEMWFENVTRQIETEKVTMI